VTHLGCPRKKMALVRALHGRCPWLVLELHGRRNGEARRRGGRGGRRGAGGTAAGGALGGSMIYGIVVTMAIGIADSIFCHRKSKG
jgi:hypothetical protein